MNENIDLTKILKGCPKGFELWTPMNGVVRLKRMDDNEIICSPRNGMEMSFWRDGKLTMWYDAECILFPSQDQRDWNKFLPFSKRVYIRGSKDRAAEVRKELDKYADGNLADNHCTYEDSDMLYTICYKREDGIGYQMSLFGYSEIKYLQSKGYHEIFLPKEEPKQPEIGDVITFEGKRYKVYEDCASNRCGRCSLRMDSKKRCLIENGKKMCVGNINPEQSERPTSPRCWIRSHGTR